MQRGTGEGGVRRGQNKKKNGEIDKEGGQQPARESLRDGITWALNRGVSFGTSPIPTAIPIIAIVPVGCRHRCVWLVFARFL